jgi:predicted PurR-regulated permease PerM
MKFTYKIIIFIGVFSLIFFGLHDSDFYNKKVILADLGGVPWLYASIGTLFSILAGFIVQKEWENWNNLGDAVSGEVNTLREMWLWSRYLPVETGEIFHNSIQSYLEEMSAGGLYKSEQNITSQRIEESFLALSAAMFSMFKNQPRIATNTFSFLTKLIEQRSDRIRYSSHHVPQSLRRIIFFATTLMICLSLFIGVKNIWLDYTYTMSVSVLAYVIFLVIDDLDHPLIPGGWHLTSKPYQRFLKEISSQKRHE